MLSVNPFLKIRCPFCRVQFHPGDCAIYSTINKDKVTNQAKLLRPAPKPGTLNYNLSRVWIEELNGPEFTAEMARRQCPHCGKLLFEGIETCENIVIAIVGDTASGKTHYIATLVDQLKRGVFMQNGNGRMNLMHLNAETDRTYRERYYKPIFQDRTAVQGTQRGTFDAQGRPIKGEPLVYQLTLQDDQAAREVNLLLYDIAGGDIADQTALVQFGEHILRADGIIYLADPMTMTSIYLQLPAHLQPDPNLVPPSTAEEVLSSVMFRLERYHRLRRGESIHIPTAITISKADLLRYVIPLSEQHNFWLLSTPTYDGKAHPEQFERLDMEVRYCLQQYHERPLLFACKRFTDVSFFAVSATGSAPNAQGCYTRIAPHRCLDPFIWLLWKLDYIESAR